MRRVFSILLIGLLLLAQNVVAALAATADAASTEPPPPKRCTHAIPISVNVAIFDLNAVETALPKFAELRQRCVDAEKELRGDGEIRCGRLHTPKKHITQDAEQESERKLKEIRTEIDRKMQAWRDTQNVYQMMYITQLALAVGKLATNHSFDVVLTKESIFTGKFANAPDITKEIIQALGPEPSKENSQQSSQPNFEAHAEPVDKSVSNGIIAIKRREHAIPMSAKIAVFDLEAVKAAFAKDDDYSEKRRAELENELRADCHSYCGPLQRMHPPRTESEREEQARQEREVQLEINRKQQALIDLVKMQGSMSAQKIAAAVTTVAAKHSCDAAFDKKAIFVGKLPNALDITLEIIQTMRNDQGTEDSSKSTSSERRPSSINIEATSTEAPVKH